MPFPRIAEELQLVQIAQQHDTPEEFVKAVSMQWQISHFTPIMNNEVARAWAEAQKMKQAMGSKAQGSKMEARGTKLSLAKGKLNF